MTSHVKLLTVAIACLALCSCQPDGPERAKLYPVSGQVLVDGQPAGGLRITAKNMAGVDPVHPTFPLATTEADGSFKFSSYEKGDGIAPGEYKLTFAWGKMMGGRYSGDKLNGRYAKVEDSQITLKVEQQPIEGLKYELTTQ